MDDKKISTPHLSQSNSFRKILIGVGIAVLVLLVFQAGVMVGFRKASFSFRGGDNFYRAFGEDRRGPFPGMMHGEFPGANGSVGKVLSIALPTLVVEDGNAVEKTILLNEKTIIRKGRATLKPSDIRANDLLVVLGKPNDNAQIEATLVRLLPPPPGFDLSDGMLMRNTTTPIQ